MNTKQLSALLGVIIVILVGVVAYLATTRTSQAPASQNNQEQEVEQSEQPKNQIFVSTTYKLEFEYPGNLESYSVEYGPTDFDKRGLTVHVGSEHYIEQVKNPKEGTEGEPVYFRVSAYEPSKPVTAEASDCSKSPDSLSSSKVSVENMIVTQCHYNSMFGSDTMVINFTPDSKTYYSFYSDQYAGATKATIDAMVQSFELTK